VLAAVLAGGPDRLRAGRRSGLSPICCLLCCLLAAPLVGCEGSRASDPSPEPTPKPVLESARPESAPAPAPATNGDRSVSSSADETVVADDVAAAEILPSIADHPLLQRVVLIGASLTQGFGTSLAINNPESADGDLPTFVPIALGDALMASMRGPFEPAIAQGDMFFFMRPDRAGQRLASMALGREPTLLVALDFLFWFGYGNLAPDETRLSRFARGTQMLSAFECPIIVADFPDLSEAVGRMISPSQMPSPDELVALNDALRTWAEQRGRVRILPLADMIEDLRSGEPVSVAGATWEPDPDLPLLQEDRMHATPAGMLVVIRQLLADMVALDPTLGTVDSLGVDPEEALDRLRQLAGTRIAPTP